ncbi:adenylate/guanylate cyclase domain-containing protein [Robiginitalea aurantiaca]|uniref:Adenylate/guanylate cyclase domain-containing protein n=1 Tax=Robiginitalea aurantiaca TaxID=3056915 RepID=A0ABT7WGV6_9FLAO|nr:adenylate/guanylate cyclase domain-containing protein [Robiginitalea aurantiaca]MDM9632156.1 adenylate/guanylate cyclase domain-containing protein [Robiginitalea aurantiaca]
MTIHGQKQAVADSLRVIYKADTLQGAEKLKLLNLLAFNEMNDPQMALEYSEELIALSESMDNSRGISDGYLIKGTLLSIKGDLPGALTALQRSAEVAARSDYAFGEASANMALADTYSEAKDYRRAEETYLKCISNFRRMDNDEHQSTNRQLGVALFNLGDLYLTIEQPEKAQKYLEEAGVLFEELGLITESYSVIGNLGRSYAGMGDYQKAEDHLLRAIELLEEAEYHDHVAAYQESLAELYSEQRQYEKAHAVAMRSLNKAELQADKPQISNTSKILARLDSITGNYREAYDHLNQHMAYKDSMGMATVTMTRLERERAELQVLKQESELELQALQQRRQRLAIWAGGITSLLLIIIAIGSYRRYRFIKKTNNIISQERDRSDGLLLNILPKQTAMELKNLGRVKAQRFDEVSVLFTDFKGFTSHAESMDPEKLVTSIDYYFSHFDSIMDKYGLEKIKTVGDAYMCASGLPYPSEDHAIRIVEAAMEILEFVEAAKRDNSGDRVRFDIRIGINSGPVVAGVVGTKKFAYDIWGDTVNIASRMESASEEGKINIAENTYALIKDHFDCENRGSIAVKNRGELTMYYVLSKKKQSQSA